MPPVAACHFSDRRLVFSDPPQLYIDRLLESKSLEFVVIACVDEEELGYYMERFVAQLATQRLFFLAIPNPPNGPSLPLVGELALTGSFQ